ncbi:MULTISPECIES: TIGR01906 family membrane protein [Lactobacillus]|uniref:TIGR01906 family membrane protein n=1 Tax=Lactobacillus xujianguonis TaxID=2495899 RepID=A0A437SSF4_9LACO|nr:MULTISPECIES: TIGR01906 family membrane protein [Lactobacillus]RVU69866.1 TIGR01906 family membrane protein [Lactobacillus xujianguonis]RVU72046.1 TIGR01906 family membrane protein [Lactobacillus xujianguonis]
MKRNFNPVVVLYHLLFALASSVVGAIIASWPLLLVFTLVQKTYATVHLSVMQVMHNYNQLLWYLIWPFKKKLQMDNLPTSADAAAHFADCKKLFLFAIAVFIVCVVMHFWAKKSRNRAFIQLDKTWALIFLILPVVILPFAITNFDSFFVVFHHLFFASSNWLFDPATDPIINVLTEGFFAACFAVAGIIYELYFAEQLLQK